MNKKKAAGLVAATLAGIFTVAAGLWSVYPENRETVADYAREFGILDPLPPVPEEPLYFITAGQRAENYLPATAVQGENANGQTVRLIYRTAIVADERHEELLAHPRINNDEEKYQALRRDTITDIMQKNWRENAARLSRLDFTDNENAAILQKWLEGCAAELYETHGLKVSFMVNTVTAVEILQSPQADNAGDKSAPRLRNFLEFRLSENPLTDKTYRQP